MKRKFYGSVSGATIRTALDEQERSLTGFLDADCEMRGRCPLRLTWNWSRAAGTNAIKSEY